MKTPPGKCVHVAIGLLVALALALLFGRPAHADGKKPHDPTGRAAGSDAREQRAVGGASGGSADRGGTGKSPAKREQTYSFGGLDIDGKLKTPQLLYFLNRMKSEFDTTTPDKRSFIPELKRSTEEM